MKIFIQKPILTMVWSAICICTISIFSSKQTELFNFWWEVMKLFYDISIWVISAGVFYLFQIYIPEKWKKQTIKQNFQKYWNHTRENIIWILLDACIQSGCHRNSRADFAQSLCDFNKFRKYFNAKHDTEDRQTRWDGVLNGWSSEHISELAIEFDWLAREINFLLIKIDIKEDTLFSFLKRLQSSLFAIQKVDMNTWEYKILSRFLWDILWSQDVYIEWYRNYDLMNSMIEKI